MGISWGARAHSRAGGVHHIERFGLTRSVGPASALDWLRGLGQGRNRGLAAKRAVAPTHKRRGSVILTRQSFRRRAGALLLAGTVLGTPVAPLWAQPAPNSPQGPSAPAAPAAPAAPVQHI